MLFFLECIVYTWDHRTSAIIWNILKVQPLLSDEVQAFKALILVHKVVKDGHPNVMLYDEMKYTSTRLNFFLLGH